MNNDQFKTKVKALVNVIENYDQKVKKAKQELKEEWQKTLQWFDEMDKQIYA